MTDMRVVDSHVHLWDPAALSYPWLAGTDLERTFDAGDLDRATAGTVDRFIVVQADCAADQAAAEVEWISNQMRPTGRLGGIVAFAPVELGRRAAPFYQRLRSCPEVVGIRRLLQDECRGFALEPEFVTGLTVLADMRVPFDVCVRAGQLPEIVELVGRLPQIEFVARPPRQARGRRARRRLARSDRRTRSTRQRRVQAIRTHHRDCRAPVDRRPGSALPRARARRIRPATVPVRQ